MYDEETMKSVRKVTLISAAIFAATGILIIIFRATVSEVIGYAIGIVLTALGAIRLVQYAVVQRKKSMLATWLYEGAILAFCGIFCLVHHSQVFGYASLIFCILLLAGSIIKIQNAIDLKRIGAAHWWVILILAAVSMVSAILLAWNPDFIRQAYVRFIGIFMLYDGLSAAFTVLWVQVSVHGIKKKNNSENEENGEAAGGEGDTEAAADAAYESADAAGTGSDTTTDPMVGLSRSAETSAEEGLAAKKAANSAQKSADEATSAKTSGSGVSTLEEGTERAFENKENLFDA